MNGEGGLRWQCGTYTRNAMLANDKGSKTNVGHIYWYKWDAEVNVHDVVKYIYAAHL